MPRKRVASSLLRARQCWEKRCGRRRRRRRWPRAWTQPARPL